ncbi:MAG: methyltransferase domain-containing protein [Proteobacteria bacterium]|nr:methyltransferase domain-containing protein [Pseudomonadota bacterium]
MSQQGSSPQEVQQAIHEQAGKLLSQVAGYIGVRTMEIGLRFGLLEEIAKHPQGITAEALAKQKALDPFYVQVWCRSAYASEVLERRENQTYRLAPYVDRLLLDQDFPGYIGGIPGLLVQPEIFDQFVEKLPSGERTWWDQCSPTFIQMVSLTSRSFYTRLIPGGLSQVPGLSDQLAHGAHLLELACGTGVGLVRMAQTYTQSNLSGVDGDPYSLELAADRLHQGGLQDRVSLVRSTLEELNGSREYDVALINASMHECRDIEKVTSNVHRALKPNGYFVISDLPFPRSMEECRTVPARIMCGIQFAEALLGDQLLPTQAYIDLLGKHKFRNIGAFELSPVHAVIYGQK